jgi:hypothetical protein
MLTLRVFGLPLPKEITWFEGVLEDSAEGRGLESEEGTLKEQ